MEHIVFEQNTSHQVALLIKSQAFREEGLRKHYIDPLRTLGVKTNNIVGYDLVYGPGNKAPVKIQKAYLEDLLPVLKEQGVEVLFVADSAYFKTLTKERKAEPHYGYVLPCAIKGYEDLKVVLVPNYQGLFYNPDIQDRIDMGMKTLADYLKGNYAELGANIIHSAKYLRDPMEIYQALEDLKKYPEITCDTETLSLKFWETGIVTIGFAWDQHNGICIWCDDYDKPGSEVRKMLKNFFYTYTGVLTYHRSTFDMKIIISTLFMDHLLDEKGKQAGIELLTRKFHDTLLIAYLATNSCAGNTLGLKHLAHEFAGNFAEDVSDIRKLPPEDLEKYQVVDCLSTWYVFNKYFPIMIQDNQVNIYEEILKPTVKVVLQMELTGMPLDMTKVAEARVVLENAIQGCNDFFEQSSIIQQFTYILREQECTKANAKLKVKVKPLSDFDHVEFNPNSNPQLQQLLYDILDFPVIDKTDKGAPAVGGGTLEKLVHHTKDPEELKLLETLNEFFAADKILNTFITAFEQAVLKADGWYYLHGNFNIGGTVSGRLSSSGPNLQNLPSTGSKYSKIIKACFVAPPGYVFMGADFASLEDRISALTTKDPQKLKVYTDGYDGHCLRAYNYFGNQMPDIVETVDSINSIKELYPELRQDSKAPTFLLTYGGTYHGLMSNVGMSKAQAQAVETNYHDMYVVSDEWVKSKIDQAAIDGYVTVAFGLRVRTPVISQCVLGNSKTPYEAQAEGRTAGNALGQSYGMLNNRAGIDLQERTMDSDYRYDILPVAHIHDAQYFIVKDDVDVVAWLNKHLVECMEWQELPEIKHPEVKLGGELSLFYPSWKDEIVLPNGADGNEIKYVIGKSLETQEAA